MTFLCRQNRITLRLAQAGDGKLLSKKLRPADRLELESSFPSQELGNLLERFREKSVFVVFGYENEEPLFLGGLAPNSFLGEKSCVWLLTGIGVETRKISFVKILRKLLFDLNKLYPFLYNFTDERYRPSLRFISRMGGLFNWEFISFQNTRFLYFTFRRKKWEES